MFRLVAAILFTVSCFATFSHTSSNIKLKSHQGEDPVININIDGTEGWLRGKKLTTIGKAQRPFFTFRNIPFAQEPERFMPPQMRDLDDVLKETTAETPYDATRAGPMCEQSNRSPASIDNLNDIIINDVVENILETVDIPLPPALMNAETILAILEQVVGVELNNKSMGVIVDDWMDMQLSASPDCLQLSVSMPTLPQQNGKLLPVMFWVYGGAFYSGSNNIYGPERLGDVADVIFVAINYRVGPLGFMCLDSENAMGNMGMLDQVMGLRWVQKYIHLFGGDKDQVTIFGESAGSASITHLLLSNLTDGMFHRAIGQSGSALAGWAFDKEPEYHARRIARKLDCDKADQEDLIQCLKDIPAINLTMAHKEYVKEERARGTMGFGGTVPCAQTKGLEHETFYFEGQHPADLLRLGNYDHMPILMGANSHEGSYVYGALYNAFIIPNNISDNQNFLTYEFTDYLLRALGIDQEYAFSDCLKEEYWHKEQIGDLTKMTAGAVDMLGVFFIKASAYKIVEENSKHGKDSYFYSIEHKSNKSLCHAAMLQNAKPHDDFAPGVCHADDLMYIFNMDIPLIMCNLEEVIPTLLSTLTRCIFTAGLDPVKLGKCIAEPDSEFMVKHGECIISELTELEMEWSESILKTWTNFAIHGSPSPDTFPADGPPAQFIEPWTQSNPVYLKFAADGVSVANDYKLTYHIALDEQDGASGKK